MTRLLAIVALALALGQVSCGGSDAGGSCGKVEPCGGPVVGSWKAASACTNQSVVNMAFQDSSMGVCPGAVASAKTSAATGSFALNADSTYSMSLTIPFEIDLSIPASCVGGMTCAEVGAGLMATADYSTVTCTGTTTCSCKMTTTSVQDESGTYTASGTTLSLVSSDGSTNGGTYCVQGDVLHLVDVDTTMDMGPMGQATIDDDVTLTKQ
jgi:hypothetical protein